RPQRRLPETSMSLQEQQKPRATSWCTSQWQMSATPFSRSPAGSGIQTESRSTLLLWNRKHPVNPVDVPLAVLDRHGQLASRQLGDRFRQLQLPDARVDLLELARQVLPGCQAVDREVGDNPEAVHVQPGV